MNVVINKDKGGTKEIVILIKIRRKTTYIRL